jgi:hypothetical protein
MVRTKASAGAPGNGTGSSDACSSDTWFTDTWMTFLYRSPSLYYIGCVKRIFWVEAANLLKANGLFGLCLGRKSHGLARTTGRRLNTVKAAPARAVSSRFHRAIRSRQSSGGAGSLRTPAPAYRIRLLLLYAVWRGRVILGMRNARVRDRCSERPR